MQGWHVWVFPLHSPKCLQTFWLPREWDWHNALVQCDELIKKRCLGPLTLQRWKQQMGTSPYSRCLCADPVLVPEPKDWPYQLWGSRGRHENPPQQREPNERRLWTYHQIPAHPSDLQELWLYRKGCCFLQQVFGSQRNLLVDQRYCHQQEEAQTSWVEQQPCQVQRADDRTIALPWVIWRHHPLLRR